MRNLLIPALVALGVLAGAPALAADVALPGDVKVVEPSADVPDAIRRFHGTWEGQWDGKLDHMLIVEKVAAEGSATVVYAWGDYPQWQVSRDWLRTTVTISGDEMTMKRGEDNVRYVFRSDGKLGGTYDTGWHRNYGTFVRVVRP